MYAVNVSFKNLLHTNLFNSYTYSNYTKAILISNHMHSRCICIRVCNCSQYLGYTVCIVVWFRVRCSDMKMLVLHEHLSLMLLRPPSSAAGAVIRQWYDTGAAASELITDSVALPQKLATLPVLGLLIRHRST